MHYVNKKNKYIKMTICCLIMILSLSFIPIHRASATDNYFTVEGSTLILNELGPDDDREVTVTVKAAREMYLSNIHGNFTPIDENDEELELDAFFGIKSYGMQYNCTWGEDGYFEWNTEACHSAYSGYEDDLHLQAGDPIFQAVYTVKPDVFLTQRSLPVTIHSALIKDGGEIAVSDIALDAGIFVYPAEDYWSINIYKEGHGNVVTPVFALPNEEIEISFVPDENNELLYAEIDDQDITDRLENNKIRVTVPII